MSVRSAFLRLATLVILASCATAPATAGNGVLAVPMTDTGYSMCQGGVCVWGQGAPPNPHVRHIAPPDSQEDKDAAAEQDRIWVQACRPTPVRDRYGIMRYTYSKPGCEFGSPK